MIEQILYSTSMEFQRLTEPARKLSELLGEQFNIPVSRYQDGWVNPNRILIGTNIAHHLAGGVSDLPLVVIDKHTDMYANGSVPLCYDYRAWVYYEIKKRSEVHLVMPTVDSLSLGRSCIPEGHEQKFHIYSLDSRKKAKFIILGEDNESIKREIEKEVESLENLWKMQGPKQISTDFDFCLSAESGILEGIIQNLIAVGNVYDFWLDAGLYQSDLIKGKPFDRYIPIFQKIHVSA